MQLMRALALLAVVLAAKVQCAPVADPQSANPQSPDTTGLVKRKNWCGNSQFHDETSGGSPLSSDCQRLADNLSGNGDWFIYVWHGTSELARYGTCRFMARTVTDWGIAVGDLDVKDLIRDSIAKFGRDGRVGARGSMVCEPGGWAVWWYIWHT